MIDLIIFDCIPDASFIAASRTGWPAHDALLLECVEEIKRLQAELESAREVVRAARETAWSVDKTMGQLLIELRAALAAHLAKYPEAKG